MTNTTAAGNTGTTAATIAAFLQAKDAYNCYASNMDTIRANNRQNKKLREEYQKKRKDAAAVFIPVLLDKSNTTAALEDAAKKESLKKTMARFIINGGKNIDGLKDKVDDAQTVLKSLTYRITSDENKKLSKDKQIDLLIQALQAAGIELPNGIK